MNKIYGPNEVNISAVLAGGTNNGILETSNVARLDIDLGANAATFQVPVPVKGEDRMYHADGIKTVSVYANVGGANLATGFVATLYKVTHSGTAIPTAVAVVATSVYYLAGVADATPVEQGFWELRITPTVPELATTGASYHVEVTCTGAGGTTVDIYGVKVDG